MVWDLINKIRTETKMTVFLTTHYLEEAEKATNVVVMNHGNIIARGTPNELKNLYTSDYIAAYINENKEFEELLLKDNIKFSYVEQGFYKILIKDTKEAKDIIKKYDKYLTDIEITKYYRRCRFK